MSNQEPKRTRRPPLTEARIEEVLRQNAGFISKSAKVLKVDPSAVRKRIYASEHLTKVLQEIREEAIDLAESAITKLLKRPNHKDHAKVAMFVLSTLGKKLGYSERHEFVGPSPTDRSAGPLQVQIFIPAKEDDEG